MEIEPLTLDCAHTEMQETPFAGKKTLFYCGKGQNLGQLAQNDLGDYPWRY